MKGDPKNAQELRALCRAWQDRLSLRDWTISVAFLSKEQIEGAAGFCEPLPKLRRARIGILRPEDYPSDGVPQDVELTLVHELLHCYHHMARFGSVADLFEEQGVEAAAKALVALKRSKSRRA